MSHMDILRYNERDLIRTIEKEKAKEQNDLTRYYIAEFEKCLEDIREQIKVEEARLLQVNNGCSGTMCL